MKGFQEIAAAVQALPEPAALATLARIRGSSYRQPGARMVFDRSGIRAGVISAGCLETDILARVQAVLEGRGPHLASYDLGSELDLVWGTGMGCQGRADVLLERVEPGAPPRWLALAAELVRARRAGALATVFEARGETGGVAAGDHFLLDPGGPGLPPGPGPFAAALGEALATARHAGATATPTLSTDQGELEVLVEPVRPRYALWIYGAGEHARPLARMASELGWFVGLVDHRPALATPERFPWVDRIVLGHPPAVLAGLALDGRTAALVVSHVYEKDLRALEALLPTPVAYLGLQGNRLRSRRLLKDLAEAGLDPAGPDGRKLHFPAGLDIGAESPEVIALAMLAEVQAVFAGRPGGHLRDRAGAIHG
jgi:xanthine/CO dehydrogenase XdhC/CoxF family maturation factor